jgi:diadenosine tetraphosphatase ApaH/serine/threonine PP2A family protein phosphatase
MTIQTAQPLYIIGDIHGQYEKLIGLLYDAALVDGRMAWSGGAARLWFMGDFFDRGPCGIEAVDLVMRLQTEAAAAGGSVRALIGNHEPLILSAQRFGERPTGWGGTFLWDWRRNGGSDEELERLTAAHIAWLADLPAMALEGEYLLVHADSTMYSSYGSSIDEVNQALRALLHEDDAPAWDRLLEQFSDRKAFLDSDADGAARAAQFLSDFGGRQIIHGHTPISFMRRCLPEDVVEPLVYAGGLCVNVDGGLYMGGPGFVYRPPALE